MSEGAVPYTFVVGGVWFPFTGMKRLKHFFKDFFQDIYRQIYI